MYIPASFAVTDPTRLRDFMRRHSFATLTSYGPEGLVASHLPLVFDPEGGPQGVLLGHFARANRQWRQVEGEVMALFAGPHAYVSPAWYDEAGTVPTWNYVAVHAYGTMEVVDDRAGLLAILRRSVAEYENPRAAPWAFDEAEPAVDAMCRAIVGFRVVLTRLEGKWKLSQNHPPERRARVRRAFALQPDANSRAIAALMEQAERDRHES